MCRYDDNNEKCIFFELIPYIHISLCIVIENNHCDDYNLLLYKRYTLNKLCTRLKCSIGVVRAFSKVANLVPRQELAFGHTA